MTVKQYLQYFTKELKDLYPREEVTAFKSYVFEYVKNWSVTDLITKADEELTEAEVAVLNDVVRRLKDFEPIQYIVGVADFLDLKIKVGKGVLIPRPETEELVHLLYLGLGISKPCNIIDICTGSACIALALHQKYKDATVHACDNSDDALLYARENIKLNNSDVKLFKCDVLQDDLQLPAGSYDLMVSNPPYVRQCEREAMLKNVLDYEPSEALFVTDDNPLLYYDAIAKLAVDYLSDFGILAFEINEFLAEEMELLLRKYFPHVKLHKDIFEKYRFITARKNLAY